MQQQKFIESVAEFIATYVTDSSIKKISFEAETKKWTIDYNYDVPPDEFNSFKHLIDFLHADQNSKLP